MKKQLVGITLILMAVWLGTCAAYGLTENRTLYSAAITLGTTFYHFAMRLTVGFLIGAKYHNQMDYTRKWFAEKPFEKKLYKMLKVKKWKAWMPTWNPQDFVLKDHSLEDVVQVTCQAEIVHEVIVLLSFVPVLFTVWFGSLGDFLLTSCAAALFDSLFVIMQRYNRPRLLRLLKRAAIGGKGKTC